MKIKTFFFCCLLILIISCKKESTTIHNVQNNNEDQDKVDQKIKYHNSKVSLTKDAKKVVEDWVEYQTIADFIPNYYKTSTSEALFNSQRLAELAQQLRDTIRVVQFDEPSFRIRLNVLYNETMRLADMDSIPSITNKEIKQESYNIVNAFQAINAKINSVVKKDLLEKDLAEFDHLFVSKKEDLEIPKPNSNNLKKSKQRKNNSTVSNKKKKFNKRIKPLQKLQQNE